MVLEALAGLELRSRHVLALVAAAGEEEQEPRRQALAVVTVLLHT